MKRKSLLLLGAVLMLLTSCATKPHYGCRNGRCIVQTQKAAVTPTGEANRNS